MNHDHQDDQDDLCDACYEGEIDVVRRLIDQGVSIQVEGEDPADLCRSPVGCAIQGGHTDIVRLLLDRGLVLQGQIGENALVVACRKTNTDIVRLLLEHVPATARSTWGWTALMVAAGIGCVETIQLLLDRGADVHAVEPEEHYTALHRAANNLRHEAYQLLVQNGANEQAQSLPYVDEDENWNGRTFTPRELLELRVNDQNDQDYDIDNQASW